MTPRNDSWTERHGAAVSDAAPAVPPPAAGELDALWRRIEGVPEAPRRRPRWRTAVAGVVAIGAIGGAGVATADGWSAHTGQVADDPESIELGGPGEYLDPDAPDFAAVVAEVTADIDFPSGEARESAVSWEAEDLAGAGRVSTGAVRLWTAGHAVCAWSDTWAVALRTGDAETRDEAAATILAARTWPAITDTDPDLTGESPFSWLPDLAQAVRDGDTSAARDALVGHGACLPGLAPALGLGRRW